MRAGARRRSCAAGVRFESHSGVTGVPRRDSGTAYLLLRSMRLMSLRRIPAPVATTAILVLLVSMIVFWGRAARSGTAGLRTATIKHAEAQLTDGACMFTAAIQLRSLWDQWTFSQSRPEVRAAFVRLLRTKSRYMVRTEVARQALRMQMASEVNRLASRKIAERVDLPEFEVF